MCYSGLQWSMHTIKTKVTSLIALSLGGYPAFGAYSTSITIIQLPCVCFYASLFGWVFLCVCFVCDSRVVRNCLCERLKNTCVCACAHVCLCICHISKSL